MAETDDPAAVECRQVRVHGLVQGIGYRDACVRQALALGVTGWVRNRSDGSVEALLQGAPGQVQALCEWLRSGVPGARVDRLEVTSPPMPVSSPLSPALSPALQPRKRFARPPTL